MEFMLFVNNELTEAKNRLDTVSKELLKCHKGHLYEQKRGKSVLYTNSYFENGKRVRKAVTNQEDVIKSLIRRKALEMEQKCLLAKIDALKSIPAFCEYDVGETIDFLKNYWPNMPEQCIYEALGLIPTSDWQQAS